MIHTSNFKPVVIPVYANLGKDEIDRVQDMSVSTTLGREKIKEIGRVGNVGWKNSSPTVTLSLKQLEYGNMNFFNELANKALATTLLTQEDFNTSCVDVLGYKTDDSTTFLGTMMYPKMRCAGFNINIGSPTALIERSFSLVGDNEIFWQNNNKYVINLVDTSCTTTSHTIAIGAGSWTTYPNPVLDPDLSGNNYIMRIVRVRSGVSTELTYTTDFTYSNVTHTITFTALSTVNGDVYKVWYTATTYISGVEPFVANDTDSAGIDAECASIYLVSSTYVYRLDSVAVDVSFDRTDNREIGNKEVVARGVKGKTVKITLGRMLEAFTIEEALRGKTGATWGKIDPTMFANTMKLIIKVYSSNAKSTFKIGYSFTSLAATNLDATVPLADYVKRNVTLEGELVNIATVEGSL